MTLQQKKASRAWLLGRFQEAAKSMETKGMINVGVNHPVQDMFTTEFWMGVVGLQEL